MATPGNRLATAEKFRNNLKLLNCNSGNTGNSKIFILKNIYKKIPVTPRAYRFFAVASVATVATPHHIYKIYNYINNI